MNQYANTRTKRIQFCLLCKTNTPHRRVYGDYLTCPAYQCCFCKIEIVIDLRPQERMATK